MTTPSPNSRIKDALDESFLLTMLCLFSGPALWLIVHLFPDD